MSDTNLSFAQKSATAGTGKGSLYGHLTFEQKLAEACKIIKEAAAQIEGSDLKLDFEIRLTPQYPRIVR